MRRVLVVLLTMLSVAFSAPSWACGVCVEDKIAATYDHAVVTRAGARHHLVVFGEMKGAVDMTALAGKVALAAARVRGIDLGTVRTSASPPAFSFALDPGARSPDSAVAEVQRRLRTQGATLSILRVVSGDAPTSARN